MSVWRYMCVSALGATVAMAQDAPPTGWGRVGESNGALDGSRAPWLDAWSPLRPIGDIPRGLLRAPLGVGLMVAPRPVEGAFMLSGSPAALARDVRARPDDARFSEIVARMGRESGSYRRPLDVTDAAVAQVMGHGWAPVGTRGVAIGRFVVDRERNDESAYTARIAPYSSVPLVMTDSVRPPMLRTRARLEGALSLVVGEYAGGLSAAVESREHNSIDFPLRRTGRMALPAVSAGLERTLPWWHGRVGVFARWQEPNESNILSARPLATELYAIQAYDEPFALPVTPLSPSVFTRNERRATSRGVTVDATVAGVRMALSHEQSERAEDQTLAPFSATRAIDRWRAEGTETRFQLSRALGSTLQAMVVGSVEALNGTGVRADLEGTAFIGTDARRSIEGDVRWTSGAWSAAARGGAVFTEHDRTDYVAQLRATVERVTPFVSGEVSRTIGTASVLIGASGASSGAAATLPAAVEGRGEHYQRLIAGDLAYEVAESSAFAGWVGVIAPVAKVRLSLTVRVEKTSPRSEALQRLQPTGARNVLSVALGVR